MNYFIDPKFLDRQALANNTDPDQTAPRGTPLGAVRSGFSLCHRICTLWTNFSMERSLNSRVIPGTILAVRKCRIFKLIVKHLLCIFPFWKLDSSCTSTTLNESVSRSLFLVRHWSTYFGLTAEMLYLLHCFSLYTQLVFFLLKTTKNDA